MAPTVGARATERRQNNFRVIQWAIARWIVPCREATRGTGSISLKASVPRPPTPFRPPPWGLRPEVFSRKLCVNTDWPKPVAGACCLTGPVTVLFPHLTRHSLMVLKPPKSQMGKISGRPHRPALRPKWFRRIGPRKLCRFNECANSGWYNVRTGSHSGSKQRQAQLTTYTTKQAALILGISERAVRKATGRGYLKHTIGEVGFGITGRIFTPEDLTQYIERRKALFGRPISGTIAAGSL